MDAEWCFSRQTARRRLFKRMDIFVSKIDLECSGNNLPVFTLRRRAQPAAKQQKYFSRQKKAVFFNPNSPTLIP